MAQVLNKFRPKDKVLIVSEQYKWGIVDDVKFNTDKSGFVYSVKFTANKITLLVPEEGLLEYMPKWVYQIRKIFSFIVW